ncbi:hypothetical protein KQI85_07000 [Falcatimonas sp. MSJ-15]|uniref:hypothetical protein n=1 Tax=Falcatimonas sp. MSJ-15 TaxID=2841515 RepID=UPI001C0F71E7|nr:hypothetical protein [Falcatimonas sp. MSJ-15]MBU5470114.1 hypothetical protein [Falcatimonas sp. MSJ-15]
MLYEEMLIESDKYNLIIKEKPLQASDGRVNGNRIAIRKDIETQVEKSCVLAEELGHYHTTSGDILNQEDVANRKQEYRARLYGYNMKIGLMGLVKAFEHGCKTSSEVAEYLDVTDEYLQDAIDCYTKKYGTYTMFNHYIIYFCPCLGVIRLK